MSRRPLTPIAPIGKGSTQRFLGLVASTRRHPPVTFAVVGEGDVILGFTA